MEKGLSEFLSVGIVRNKLCEKETLFIRNVFKNVYFENVIILTNMEILITMYT